VRLNSNFTVILEDLPVECTETDLIILAQGHGKVSAVNIHRNTTVILGMSMTPRFGSVLASMEFQVKEQAEDVCIFLTNTLVWGRQLR
jgi:hypothetical protein